jgi:plastocyanin
MLLPLLLAPVLLVALIGLVGTNSGSATSSAPAGPRAITIDSFVYAPNPVAAKVGDTIVVTNNDGTDHTATADDQSFDTEAFASGMRTITVTHAGTITYHCDIHNFMTGAIQVTGS